MFNKELRIVVAVMLALPLMLLASPAANAAIEGSVGGSFAIGNATPVITTVELYSDSGLTSAATDITPLTTYYAKVTVGDANRISDIIEVKLELFYDATPDDPVAPGSANTQTNAIFTWTNGGDFVMTAMTDTTWSLEDVAGASVIPSDMTAISGDWVFAFKAGKVTTESAGLAGNWDMYAKATDGIAASHELYERNKNILWYGEVSTVTTTVGWGTVTAGSGFSDNTNMETGIAITYIANGDYSTSVKAVDWDDISGTSGVASYDDTGATSGANDFSLAAFTTDNFTSKIQVTMAGAVVDSSGTLTVETGNATTTNTLWLKLAATFSNDTYTGSITYIITNR